MLRGNLNERSSGSFMSIGEIKCDDNVITNYKCGSGSRKMSWTEAKGKRGQS